MSAAAWRSGRCAHAPSCSATTTALLLLLCLLAIVATTHAEYVGARAPSGASCRVFVLAGDEQTRFALVESYVEQDGVDVYDDFPAVAQGIHTTPLEDVYRTLRPSFLAIQTFLRARPQPLQLEPRHCHAHLMTIGPVTRALDASLLDALFTRVHEDSIEDAQFPFLLARDDLRALSSERLRFYLVAGANYLYGRVPAALTPGDDSLYGLFRYTNDSASMAFDVLERWRRSKRSKQRYAPLDTSDLFSREYEGYGAAALQAAVDKQLIATGDPKRQHVCVPTAEYGSDAPQCMRAIHAVVQAGNAACPATSYCAIGGVSQLQPPLHTFVAAGLFRAAVTFASRVLAQQRDAGDSHAPTLELPLPTLAKVRSAADYICKVPLATLQKASNSVKYAPERKTDFACFDLCATVVLLQTFGVANADARVQFGTSEAVAADEQRAWLTGAFLHLDALQQRRAFAVEAELLAVQVDAGVPIGLYLSALLLVVALAFVYATSGRRSSSSSSRYLARRTSSSSSSYERVVNGSSKAKQPHAATTTTQAILFIDDASE